MLGELRSLVEDLAEEGRARTEAVEAEAEERVGRFHGASEELAAARREIARLEKDREQLPSLAFKANMDEDYEREDELREKYRAIRPALESLRVRAGELEAELGELVGKNRTPRADLDAMIFGFERVRDAYGEAAAPLVSLQTRVSVLLSDAVDPLVGGHRATGQTLMGLRSERDGDPEVRARSMERRGIRPEFVGAKPKPGV